jgi:hypothetical protein
MVLLSVRCGSNKDHAKSIKQTDKRTQRHTAMESTHQGHVTTQKPFNMKAKTYAAILVTHFRSRAAVPYCDIAAAEVRVQLDTKHTPHAPGSAQALVCGGGDNVSILKW